MLRNFTKLDGHLTEVNAAASLHPTLATVWLGANDVLKYMGSGGRFVGGDRTAGQVESDLRATISTLQHAGARVVVANLPNILRRPTSSRDDSDECQRSVTYPTDYAYCVHHKLRASDDVAEPMTKELADDLSSEHQAVACRRRRRAVRIPHDSRCTWGS